MLSMRTNSMVFFALLALWAMPTLTNAAEAVKNMHKKDKAIMCIKGDVRYRERMALPPHALLEVTLKEMPSARIIATAKENAENRQIPLPFTLTFPAKELHAKMKYELTAHISADNTLLFTSAEPTVLEMNMHKKAVSLLLHRTINDNSAARDAQKLEKEIKTEFTDTYWKLKAIGGKAVQTFENQAEAHLYFDKNGTLRGSDGCNNFFGTWGIADAAEVDSIMLAPAGASMMACPQGMEQAHAFVQAQSKINHWKKTDNLLLLMNSQDVLLTLEGQHF